MPKPDDASIDNDLDDASKIQSVVENANAEDEKDLSADDTKDDDDLEEEESGNDDDASDEDDSEEENSDEDDEDDEDKSKKKDPVERKFKNLASDDDKEYISNIEKAYENSTAEALRLNTELGNATRRINALMQAVGSDPELADRLNKAMTGQPSSGDDGAKGDDSPNPTENPFLTDAQTQWRQKSAKEVQEILDANPELLSDPELNNKVRHWMEVFSAEEYKNNKRLMTGGEAMEAAMRYLGIQDKRKKQEVASKAKDLAAPTRPQSSKKPKSSSSKGVSDAAYKFGELMGVSKESVDKYAQ